MTSEMSWGSRLIANPKSRICSAGTTTSRESEARSCTRRESSPLATVERRNHEERSCVSCARGQGTAPSTVDIEESTVHVLRGLGAEDERRLSGSQGPPQVR